MVDSNIVPIKQAVSEEAEITRWVWEHLAGSLDCGGPRCACGSTLRQLLLTRVLGALPPPGTTTVRAGTRPWIELAPGVTVNLLRMDTEADNMTVYVRMQPGAVYAAHRHTQSEECLVIEGEIFIGGHSLRAGDMHFAASGTEHAEITSPGGALMLVRCQAC